MKTKEFNQIVEGCIEVIRKSLPSKGKEYALDNEDRLVNFKRGGEMERTTPEKALIGYWLKHIVSIFELIDRLEKENQKVGLSFIVNPSVVGITEEIIEEKIKDLVNYPILLKALLKERMN